ncbi:hypothetical protein CCH79_00017704 [Gambusia affinis]|uniref:Uncharacterized protein n=1 Tax=Gambusia affinis TaxID=33528 RepID=A0A315VB26_GAMAF|nr:hypothetical protein CCH79_00017704 [Gambusia affinis]
MIVNQNVTIRGLTDQEDFTGVFGAEQRSFSSKRFDGGVEHLVIKLSLKLAEGLRLTAGSGPGQLRS